MGKSPKADRRRRLARIRERSLSARAKSEARVSRRLMLLRDVIPILESRSCCWVEKAGQSAVIVGPSLNCRLVPFIEPIERSHLL